MPRKEDFNRAEVLDKAKNVFWLKGYNGTSMQDLVDAMGLNRSSIYNSFGNKLSLYQESLEHYKSETVAMREKVLQKDKNSLEIIGLMFLYAMRDIVGDTANKGCMIINCATELGSQYQEVSTLVQNNQNGLFEFFEKLVKSGQKEGSIRKDETSEMLAYYLASAFQGFRITGLNLKDEKALKGIIQNTLRAIT